MNNKIDILKALQVGLCHLRDEEENIQIQNLCDKYDTCSDSGGCPLHSEYGPKTIKELKQALIENNIEVIYEDI